MKRQISVVPSCGISVTGASKGNLLSSKQIEFPWGSSPSYSVKSLVFTTGLSVKEDSAPILDGIELLSGAERGFVTLNCRISGITKLPPSGNGAGASFVM